MVKRNELSEEENKLFRAKQMEIFERNMAAYEAMDPKLIEAHRGEYVGIVDGSIVGFSKDESLLEMRIRGQHGNVHIYTRVVGEDNTGQLRGPTPRLSY
jgi:hypothetical protein